MTETTDHYLTLKHLQRVQVSYSTERGCPDVNDIQEFMKVEYAVIQ